jgi:serine/threonine protein kinase
MPVHQQYTAAPRGRSTPTPGAHVLGPWRLVRHLGEGTWNHVYQAAPADANEDSPADYAVKVLKPACLGDIQAIAQLRREALVLKTISHPHLQCVLSCHVERAPYYLVMPYQRGASLRTYLRKYERLPLAQSMWIVRQVAEALDALHEQEWIHCDVKPDNVYVAKNGHVTLGDLGLARPRTPLSPTQTMIAGTPAYMPPEAFCVGGVLSGTSDAYSLGVMLFELLTGQYPFPHTSPDELGAAHRMLKPPDPRTYRPDIPATASRLIRNLLAKEPLRRPIGQELIQSLVDLEIETFEFRFQEGETTDSALMER